MPSITDIQKKRFQYLRYLYENSGADPTQMFNRQEMAQELGLSEQEARSIALYMGQNNLTDGSIGAEGISTSGIVEYERVVTQPDQPTMFFPSGIAEAAVTTAGSNAGGGERLEEDRESKTALTGAGDSPGLDLFISHRSKDAPVAEALINLIRTACNVPAKRIRCTSVTGHRLDGGTPVQERLRAEVRDAVAFVGLVTPESDESAFVMFELGARWGAGLPLIPVLARGATGSDLGGWLSDLNGLDGSDRGQAQQLVSNLADAMKRHREDPEVYNKQLDLFVKACRAPRPKREANLAPASPTQIPGEVEPEGVQALRQYRHNFKAFLRLLEAEWSSERDSDPDSIEEGKGIVTEALARVLDFRSQIVDSTNLEVPTALAKIAVRLRVLQRHRMYTDGGDSFHAFWAEGDAILESLHEFAALLDKVASV